MRETRLVLEVPFISWENENLPGGEMNPSHPASMFMVLKYWGIDPFEIDWSEADAIAHAMTNWITETRQGASVDELAPFIADGIPIIVAPTDQTDILYHYQ